VSITAPPSAEIHPRGSGAPESDATCTVVWVRGEHDLASLVALSDTLARATALDDADLVVDLSGVAFMDASTLGAIVTARNGLRIDSRTLTLRAPSARADRVLRICGLADPSSAGP
jgi:anti-sigma B factor antagonist